MSFFTRQSVFLTVYTICVCSVGTTNAEAPLNVLMLAIDDLRPELGCYGNAQVQSPNIDTLAASGRLFQRAYCQQAVCNPSRTSLMTGLRPDSNGVTGNHIHFRSNRPNVVTLPQHFKQNGYHAQSIGKIYHGVFPDGASKTTWDTMGDPQSWSVPTTRFGPRYYYTESGIEQAKQSYLSSYRPKNPQPNDWTQKLVFGPMTEAPDVDDETLYDGKVAAAAVQTIRKLKDAGQPFFLAVGFIKPHTPFVAPKKYWDLYDPEEIDLASRDSLPEGAPAFAGHGSGEIRRYTDQPNQGEIPEANRRRLKHGYYACISYIDAQVGKVLKALKENELEKNTIVVLFGDHGYHLGEHGLWGKTTNFELDTRVPLIIRTPGMKEPGIATSSLAELVDLYPTLAELVGLAVSEELDGTSLTAELESSDASTNDVALSQYPRGKRMGYSIRTNQWRYTEWIERGTKRIVDRELYDHQQQKPIETENLINDSRFVAEIKELSKRLHQEIGISPNNQKPENHRPIVFQTDGKYGYRIPAITTSKSGTLLAFAERRVGLHDHAKNDIVLRRSRDGGSTWLKQQVLADEGGDSLNDPCVVVLESGRILLRYTRFPEGVHARASGHTVIAEPGYDGPKNVRVYLMHSDDEGLTWSTPEEVTKSFRRESAVSVGSPGKAIQLKAGKYAGRILFPIYEVDDLGNGTRKFSNAVVYSDDGGTTWILSNRLSEGDQISGGNEAQLIELTQGEILITSRNQRGDKNLRKLARSKDGGVTWSSLRLASELVTPPCMSSVERIFPPTASKQGWLVHSLPNTQNKRANGTLFLSKDEGLTWQKNLQIEPNGFAYNCLVELPSGDLGCLYEADGYKTIQFAQISLKEIAEADSTVATVSDLNTSFEECPVGAFTKVETSIGIFSAEKGHAEIDPAHRYSGKQCLHILGGEKRTVDLTLNQQKVGSSLTFQAERWTRRSPFEFRIQQSADGKKWKEIYQGDKVIKIGGFLTKVTIPIDKQTTKLRFICTSPSSSGILIDDLSLVPPTPQKILGVTVEDIEVPVLIGLMQNPLLKIRIDAEGTLNPISITELQASLFGSDLAADVQSVTCYSSGDSPNLSKATKKFGEDSKGDLSSKRFTGEIQLQHGANYFWFSCELDSKANIDHTLQAICESVKFSDGKEVTIPNDKILHRLGVAVRNGGDDGVHTYRIPGLATTNKGTLIGVYDIRNTSGGDLPGNIDVGMSRSSDGGRTWETMQNIMDMGNDPNWRYDGIGDPAVLVDQNTGTIWVAATWSHGNRSWVGSGPGLEPEETGQLMLVKSDDDGVTWSKPVNITKQVKDPKWSFILQGPGKGITMHDGTIVFAAQYQDSPEDRRLPHSTIIYSKDHGTTWQVGTGAFDDTTEAQVVEIEPGVLMLNCRYNRKSVRVVMVTKDMGKTWEKHSTSERALIEPRSCMASLINVDQELGKDVGGWLLFSNPDSLSGRNHITIKGSRDKGTSWPKEHRLLLDEGSGRGYSCMSMIDDQTVGILYEGSRAHMTFQRVKLSDIQGENKNKVSKIEQPAQLTLPQVFSDHMVLQADAELPIWGTAKPGSEVTMSLGNQIQTTKADESGNWRVRFPARQASFEPVRLTIQTDNSHIELKDILFGEVWLCAGQSNMEWKLSQTTTAKEELANAANHKHLRLLHLKGGATGSSGVYSEKHLARLTPEKYCEGEWQVASADSAKDFSAVAWHFGRRLQQELKVPVGLICPAVGGTPAESWISRKVLESDPSFKDFVSGHWLDNPRLGDFCKTRGQQNLLAAIQAGARISGDESGPNHSFKPGFMWSAGIEPLIPFAIKGVVWYQGESNAESMSRTKEHQQLFTLLINQWRAEWNQGEFPFLFVQLPAINREFWPWFREGQRQAAQQLSNVGMAVTIDTGHPSNVHPQDKETVGNRLAYWALGNTYNQDIATSAPLVQQVVKKNESIQLTFDHAEEGLQSSDEQPLRHFEISGKDGVFYPATAQIAKDNLLLLSSSYVKQPQHVRYAWAPYPDPPVNLINSAGLPASPFTTEDTEELYDVTSTQAKDQRPNILLIVGEDHGCELSCYGDPVITTPHIDQLAAEGVLFEKGYVTQSVCSPSRSTIFTGLYPHQNGQLGLATHNYGWFKKWPTSYSLLKGAGYRTGLIGKTHVIPADAVESHVDFRYQPSANFAKKQVAQYAVEAGKFFRESAQLFFMTVNYPDAHWPLQGQVGGLPETQVDSDKVQVMPYVGDANPRLKKVVQNYYDCMLRLDACVGQLLKQLKDSGKSENTLVIFIGDHGAQMARGKVTVYEGGMRVPYIVKWPDHTKAGLRSNALVSTIDLLPTFLDAAGIQSPKGLPGKTIRSTLTDQSTDFREYLACERNCDSAHLTFPQRTIRDSRFKLIYSPVHDREDPAARYYRIHGASHWAGCLTDKELLDASQKTQEGYARWLNPPLYQLYDLKSDPHEWNDLANLPEFKQQKQRLITALKDWQSETADPITDPEKLKQLMDENDAVNQAKRRNPAGGWKYLDYWHPDNLSKVAPSNN
ncbi:MAG: sulfatase-like hydrolase/transferase [Pirellulales bacterium]